MALRFCSIFCFFFFNDTATTEIYTLSLHDALPICNQKFACFNFCEARHKRTSRLDRKSTRLNSSHLVISYAVFCLKKKKTQHRSLNMSVVQWCVRGRRVYFAAGSLELIHDRLQLFFFNDPAPTDIYSLSLQDALPI